MITDLQLDFVFVLCYLYKIYCQSFNFVLHKSFQNDISWLEIYDLLIRLTGDDLVPLKLHAI